MSDVLVVSDMRAMAFDAIQYDESLFRAWNDAKDQHTRDLMLIQQVMRLMLDHIVDTYQDIEELRDISVMR